MIVIPMLGKSSRFFSAGYTQPKYQLPLAGETVFSHSVKSFSKYFDSEHFLFLVRNEYDARHFVAAEATRLDIKDFRIVEFSHETRGQAESVALGTGDYHDRVPLLIFNIDTIRHNFIYPDAKNMGDGFLEVFNGEGSNWSFIEPGSENDVLMTTEKERISDLCSNGLYFFSRAGDFREAFQNYVSSGQNILGEIYIAPLYNYLVKHGRSIKFQLIDPNLIDHCGTPADYEKLKLRQYTEDLSNDNSWATHLGQELRKTQ